LQDLVMSHFREWAPIKAPRGSVRGIGLLLLLLLIAAPATAAGPQIGQVKTVSGQAFILRDGARSAAQLGDALYEKDTIETGADGSIGVTFVDDTVFSAGPNSEVALDEYRFDSSNFKGGMLANMRRGTLSVVSGDIPRSTPGAMKIRTPTAILGVRGTTFAVQVSEAR
jgi:hypothetical protein